MEIQLGGHQPKALPEPGGQQAGQARATPARQEEKTTMKSRPTRSAVAADASRRRPDYVIELAVNPDLRDRGRRAAATHAQPTKAKRGKTAEPDPDPPLAEREAEP